MMRRPPHFHQAGHRVAVDRQVVDRKRGEAALSRQVDAAAVGRGEPVEPSREEARNGGARRVEHPVDRGEHARVGVHPCLAWRPSPVAQLPDEAPQEQRLEAADMVQVLVAHENVTDRGRLTAGGDELTHRPQAVARVQEYPVPPGGIAPLKEDRRLVAPLIGRPASPEESDAEANGRGGAIDLRGALRLGPCRAPSGRGPCAWVSLSGERMPHATTRPAPGDGRPGRAARAGNG